MLILYYLHALLWTYHNLSALCCWWPPPLRGFYSCFVHWTILLLLGAHTFGRVHCAQVARRFFGFNSTTGMDPMLASDYGVKLRSMCPQPIDNTARIPAEPITPDQFDENYYTSILQNRGLLTSDAELLKSPKTSAYVTEYANNRTDFFQRFVAAMLKMGRVGVNLGSTGQIRRVCSSVNWWIPNCPSSY